METMDNSMIAGVAGLFLSLVFSYVPKLKDWYNAQTGEYKSLVMLGSLVAACLIIFGASCADLWVVVACNAAGAKSLIPLFISALIANQGTYLVTRKVAR
jgi:hypothetical protein